ncbi:glycerophosphodiester phosphodiesterase 1 isoform X2 [Aethina tumida]|uniref:glycerophosphodiester phosphodiesterase 1 isoform X2 n=1 Tax=Aethina tumida TaxID=116153 RepID=UPI00096B3591|nr:glycerophosphodiester phosphodiesterase 1 isoform X2 [Aethina tumida]
MNPALRPLIQSCVTVTFVLYAFLSLFREAFFSPLPFGFILTLGLICAIHLLRVPAPEKSSVEAIFGAELSEPEGIKVTTIAHRGALLDAPENSLAAFEMCKNEGPIAVEFDICLTSDGVPIVFHDSTLERMTGLPQVVSETKWEELSKIDISVKHLYKDRYPNTNIPTLEQTITQLLASGQKMIIDIKDNNTKMVKVIHDLFKNHNELYSRAVVSTFFPNLIYLIRRGDPKIVCSMAWRPHAFAYTSYSYPEGKGPKKYEQWYKHFAALGSHLYSSIKML